jgi:Holliday junction resolvase-like predicted endonuclease
MLKAPPADWTILPGFCLSAEEVECISGVSLKEVKAVLDAFTLKDRNTHFSDASAFNSVAASPLIPLPDGRVLLLQYYSIVESLYESPFYWMAADDAYKATAFKHRGEFTESFVVNRLTKVFGAENVLRNVDLFQGKNKAGEIDVLVTFGDRLIVVQAKSKRLTLEARKGNDGQIKADFQKAITDSYEQGLLCARHLLAGDCVLRSPQNSEIKLPWKPKEVFILNVVSDHYPALSFQGFRTRTE